MEQLGRNRITERGLHVLELPSLDELPATLNLPGQYFGLFLVIDARQVTDETIRRLASSLIRVGMAYICIWGPDCERVHDLFDEVIVGLNPNESVESVKMTTWLAKEGLDGALWHFLNVAFPADDYWNECKAELVVVVDNQKWASHIRARLKDQESLSKDVAGEYEDENGAV
jgi:hypothetical protein